MVFQWQLLAFIGNYGLSMTIMGSQWQLWVFIGNYGFIMAIIGLTFLCIHVFFFLSNFFIYTETTSDNLVFVVAPVQ